MAGISPGGATAIGALASGAWTFRPGSDVGLRGLPGQLISGDSGWLSTGETAWTFWRKESNALQLVPFLGAGGVSTSVDGIRFSETVGSNGVLARWINDAGWLVELGEVEQFSTADNPGVWTDWALGDGLYAKVQYCF